MLQAVEGVYKNGSIELAEMPEGVSESRVIVTFLEVKSTPQANKMMTLGIVG